MYFKIVYKNNVFKRNSRRSDPINLSVVEIHQLRGEYSYFINLMKA